MAKTRMTALEMASALRKQGVNVELIFRKEGGARITFINGQHYKGSEGNTKARELLGVDLSEKQKKHLRSIRTAKGQFGGKNKYKAKTLAVNEAFKQAVKEGRFKYKEDKRTGKPRKPPKVTFKKIQYRLKKEGEQGVEDYLERVLKYAKGFVYDEAIETLIKRLEADIQKRNSNYARSVVNALKAMMEQKKQLKESDFEDLQSLVYSWEQGVVGSKDFRLDALAIISKAE